MMDVLWMCRPPLVGIISFDGTFDHCELHVSKGSADI